MKGFNILAYLRRVVKYVVFYTILIVAMLAVVYFTSDNPNITFWEHTARATKEPDPADRCLFAFVPVSGLFKKRDIHQPPHDGRQGHGHTHCRRIRIHTGI